MIVATYDVAGIAALSIFDERKTCLKTRREGERSVIIVFKERNIEKIVLPSSVQLNTKEK